MYWLLVLMYILISCVTLSLHRTFFVYILDFNYISWPSIRTTLSSKFICTLLCLNILKFVWNHGFFTPSRSVTKLRNCEVAFYQNGAFIKVYVSEETIGDFTAGANAKKFVCGIVTQVSSDYINSCKKFWWQIRYIIIPKSEFLYITCKKPALI